MDSRYVRYKDRYDKKAPSRAEHLEKFQWKKGQSGNPEGRPTGGISLVERLKAYLRRNPGEAEAIIVALVKEGRLGNIIATKELLDRIDGKVVETHKIEGEMPIKILFVPAQQLLDEKEQIQGNLLEEGKENAQNTLEISVSGRVLE